ncbi:hypothetical protein E4T48_02644 [Aureobasidium sp. EXF-10727]|nr:hypothetical protein E4T48_02644 [Aureobasidium sp. EXF-10727]
MPSTNQPSDLSIMAQTGITSAMSPVSLPLRKLAPHRKCAKKFLTLPDELLHKISGEFTPEDLPNFRLTCKTLANIAAKQFGEKRLAHRRFIHTGYSMKGLIQMTAHPVFGPCGKSIMLCADHLTNNLNAIMCAMKEQNITDNDQIVHILRAYNKRWLKRKYAEPALRQAFRNLAPLGTKVSLGIFNTEQQKPHGDFLLHGYGWSREYDGLPFTEFASSNQLAFKAIKTACSFILFRPTFFEFDLHDQGLDFTDISPEITDLVLRNGRLISPFDFNVCIREGVMDIGIFLRRGLHRLEFKQRPVGNEMLIVPEEVIFELNSWAPFGDALLSESFTHLRIESCSMRSDNFVEVLESLAGTLQVLELIDVAFWGDQSNIVNMNPILHCLRHDLRLHTLVLDDVRAMNKDYGGDTGITLTKGRFWHGQQQIHAGLDVLAGYDGNAWDGDFDDWFEDGIRDFENRISIEYHHQHYSPDDGYEDYLAYKAQEERNLEDYKQEYEEYKASRASAKEAMARVEARDFSS